MTVRSALIFGKDEADAIRASTEHADFDVIPIIVGREVTGYFERDSKRATNIEVNDLISDGTSLIDLVDIFQQRKFSFVLSHQFVSGYIQFRPESRTSEVDVLRAVGSSSKWMRRS